LYNSFTWLGSHFFLVPLFRLNALKYFLLPQGSRPTPYYQPRTLCILCLKQNDKNENDGGLMASIHSYISREVTGAAREKLSFKVVIAGRPWGFSSRQNHILKRKVEDW
jgi:hypothetical protein